MPKGKGKNKKGAKTSQIMLVQQIKTMDPTTGNPIIQMEAESGQFERLPYIEIYIDMYLELEFKSNEPWYQLLIDPEKLPGFSVGTATDQPYIGPIYKSLQVYTLPKFNAGTGNECYMILSGIPAYPAGVGHPDEGNDADDIGTTNLFQQQRRFVNPQVQQDWWHVCNINFTDLQHHQQQIGQVNYKWTQARADQKKRLHCLGSFTAVQAENGQVYARSVKFKFRLKYAVPFFMESRCTILKRYNTRPTANVNGSTTQPETQVCFPVVTGLNRA